MLSLEPSSSKPLVYDVAFHQETNLQIHVKQQIQLQFCTYIFRFLDKRLAEWPQAFHEFKFLLIFT